MITMEPLEVAVDPITYHIIDRWFGRKVSGKLLYKPPEESEVIDATVRPDRMDVGA